MTPVGPLYLGLFFWTYKLLKKDDYADMPTDQLIREETTNNPPSQTEEENNAINTDENVINEKEPENNQIESKDMDDMNKLNQTMSCYNFKAVMKMCGRTIVNLGIIYFSYFICISCLVIRDCDKIDIPFLPLETNEIETNKTQPNITMEYINMNSMYLKNDINSDDKEVVTYEKIRKGKFEFN